MNITCGTDIIEISRVEEALSDLSDKFTKRIYTNKEIEYCESKNKQKYQHYAARFAAKEAIFKAISKELDGKFSIEWKEIGIENDINGRPIVNINHEITDKIENIDLSMSHCREYAIANVVVVFK